ncbi:MAG: metallophosphoesterase, partial [Planctomycetota bacterium]
MSVRSFIVLIPLIASLVGCGPPGDLLAGATWLYSLDVGRAALATPPTIAPGAEAIVVAWATFGLPSTAGIAGLQLHLDAPDWREMEIDLNGHAIHRPVEGMSYRVIPGVDPAFLEPGRNGLLVVTRVRNAGDRPMQAEPMRAALVPMTADELAFQTGPILGAFDETKFTVTCRTNMLADVTLRARPADGGADDTLVISERGVMHRFDVPRPADAGPMVYRLEAAVDDIVRTTAWLPVPNWADVTDGAMRFAVASDVQKVSWTWPTISRAIAGQDPDLLVFTGDMVWRGTNNWEWDEQFFGPARELLARTPLYFAVGNHEKESPLITELLTTPAPNGRDWNWSQQIGDVLLIGIVGHYRFGPETTHYAWL